MMHSRFFNGNKQLACRANLCWSLQEHLCAWEQFTCRGWTGVITAGLPVNVYFFPSYVNSFPQIDEFILRLHISIHQILYLIRY